MSSTPTPLLPADLFARERPATPLALAGLLALALLVELALPPAPLPTLSAAAPRRPAGGGVLATALPSSDPAILARPLFSPERSARTAEAAAPAGSLALLGLARAGSLALATVQDGAGAPRTLRPGEAMDGWRLAAVGGGRAVFTRAGAVQSLRVGAGPAAAPPPSPAATGQP